jgi:hypothetical protein
VTRIAKNAQFLEKSGPKAKISTSRLDLKAQIITSLLKPLNICNKPSVETAKGNKFVR